MESSCILWRIVNARYMLRKLYYTGLSPPSVVASVLMYIYICNMHIRIHMLIVRAVTCILVSPTKALIVHMPIHGVSIEGQQIDRRNAQYWSLYAIDMIIRWVIDWSIRRLGTRPVLYNASYFLMKEKLRRNHKDLRHINVPSLVIKGFQRFFFILAYVPSFAVTFQLPWKMQEIKIYHCNAEFQLFKSV